MTIKTADIYDQNPDGARLCDIDLRSFGRRRAFGGLTVTLKVIADHRDAKEIVAEPGEGRVLVIDGGGSKDVALFGDGMAAVASERGWSGVIVFGAIRDSDEIDRIDIGVKALCTTARKSPAWSQSERDVPIRVGTLLIRPGEWIYADSDAVLLRTSPWIGA